MQRNSVPHIVKHSLLQLTQHTSLEFCPALPLLCNITMTAQHYRY